MEFKVQKKLGRKSIINTKLIEKVAALKSNGLTIYEISNQLKISRSTIYKILKEHLDYKSNFYLKKTSQ